MAQRNSLILAIVLIVAATSFAGTWMAAPGKGSHAAAAAGATALRSMSNTTYASRTNTTITAPSGIADGDILILSFILGGASPPSATLPAGFTLLQGPNTRTVSGFSVIRRLAWKYASGESGDYTVTHTSSSSQGAMLCISGGVFATPVSSDNSGTGTTTTATGITTPSNNALVAFIVHNWALYGSASAPSGTTPTFTEQLDSASSLMYVATGVLATAGATGNKTQANGNSAPDGWGAFLVGVGNVLPTGALATDTFTRANENPITGNWTAMTGLDTFEVSGNTAIPHSLFSACGVYYNPLAWNPIQYAQCKVTITGTSANNGAGPAVRMSTSANTFYAAVIDASGNYAVLKNVAGTTTNLRTGTVTYSAGAVMKLSVTGSTLTLTYNGSQVGATISDSSITSGNPGIYYSNTLTTASVDDWEAGAP